MADEMRPKDGSRGPWQAPRKPGTYPSSKIALLPGRQQDWVYARAQYELGIKSVALIAREIGVSTSAVFSHAGNENWVRDREVLAKKEIEVKATLQQEASERLELEKVRAERVNAEMQALTLVNHRADIRRARLITMKLFKELEEMMDNLPALEALGEILRVEDDKGRDKQNDAYMRAISLGDRVDINKKLSEALKVQLQLERQAFGIQGALEDPEVQDAPRVGASEIDKILGKFDLVMKKKGSVSSGGTSSPLLGEVIDVPTLN